MTLELGRFTLHLFEDYSQLLTTHNWYEFHAIMAFVEYDPTFGTLDFDFALLGLRASLHVRVGKPNKLGREILERANEIK